MSYISETQKAIYKIDIGRILADSELLEGIISRHKASTKYREAIDGRKYYNGKHDVLNNNFNEINTSTGSKQSAVMANNQVVNNYHSLLVDQKKDYTLGNTVKFTAGLEDTLVEKFADKLNEEFKNFIDNTLDELTIGASNTGKEALLIYINSLGEFDYTVIPAEQLIEDYDEKGQLKSVLRFYEADYQNEKGELSKTTDVEIWTEKETHFYVKDNENKKFIRDYREPVNPKPHFWLFNTDSKQKTPAGFGKPPFIFLKNNNICKSDLQPVKTLIDVYNKMISRGANNIEDVVTALMVVKGLRIQGGQTEFESFLEKVRTFKSISVGEGGGVDLKANEIPAEFFRMLEEIIRKQIFRIGRGVDTQDDSFSGGGISGIALQMKYAGLDMKANEFAKQLQSFATQLVWFYAKYESIKPGGDKEYIGIYNYITLNVSKKLIVNENEIIDNLTKLSGIIPREIVYRNLPYTRDNVDEALKMMEAEESAYKIDFATNDIPGDEG